MPFETVSPEIFKTSGEAMNPHPRTIIRSTAIGRALVAHFQVYKDVFKGSINEPDFEDDSAKQEAA